jgi:aconitate hydratase
MLGLTFAKKEDYDLIRESDVIDVLGLKNIQPGQPVQIKLNHADGSSDLLEANHTLNENQIKWLRAGSALNLIREENK